MALEHHARIFKGLGSLFGFCIFPFFIGQGNYAQAQLPNAETNEDWLLQQSTEANQTIPEALLEEWHQLSEQTNYRKIDLNKADRQTLIESGKLNSLEIDALVEHRIQFGPLIDWYELQALAVFTVQRINELSAWFYVSPGHQKGSWKQSFQDVQHRILFRLQQNLEAQAGYHAARKNEGLSHYLGPQHAFRSQYRQTGGLHQLVLAMSRDAGESGIDQFGGHLALQSSGRWKRLVLGDFHLRIGEGLVANTLFGQGRSTWIDQFVFNGSQLRGASGLQSFGAFRGVAATYQLNSYWHWLPWLFSMRWSGSLSVSEDKNAQHVIIGSIRENGLHRTPSEYEQRRQIAVQGVGSQLFYSRKKAIISIHAQYMQLPGNLGTNEMLHQQLWPVGPVWFHFGMAHRWQARKWQSQGEIAWQYEGGMAFLQQLYCIPHSKVQMRLSGRWYAPNYLSHFANSLHRGSRANNENGILMQLQYQLSRQLQLALFSDWVWFPWARFQVPAPSKMREERLSLRYQLNKSSALIFLSRFEETEIASPENGLHLPLNQRLIRNQLRFQQQINEQWELQWWWGKNFMQQNSLTTHASLVALQLRFKSDKWSFASQYCLFDAKDYENRFYQPEPDVLHGIGLSSLSGEGARLVAMCQYKTRYLQFWMRYARSAFSDRTSVGTGLEASEGSVRSQISLQCQITIR